MFNLAKKTKNIERDKTNSLSNNNNNNTTINDVEKNITNAIFAIYVKPVPPVLPNQFFDSVRRRVE